MFHNIQGQSDCHDGEVEGKNGFEERHSAFGRSKKLKFTDGVGNANLVREGRNETLLYTLGTPRPFLSRSESEVDEVSYGEMSYFQWEEQYGLGAKS
jgi:hypothetical protein